MGSRSALPVLLFTIALFAGGFYLFSSRGGGEGRQVAGNTAPQAVAPGETAPATLEPTKHVENALSPSRPDNARSVASTPRAVEEEPQAAPAPDRTAGVFGVVADALGQPIEGARVFPAGRLLSFDPRGWSKDRWVAETDAQGRFALDGLTPGPLKLAVRASGYAPFESHDVSVPPDAKIELDPFTLELGAILTGRVIDQDGRGVADAELVRLGDETGGFVVFGAAREPTAVADDAGYFRLDELAVGPWKVLVQSDDQPDRVFEGVTDRPGEVAGLEFRLERGATIAGQVSGVPAEERGALAVRARRVDPDGGFSFEMTRRSRQAEVDSSGRFEIRGLEPGETYELTARTRPRGETDTFFFQQRSRSEAVRARAGDRGVDIRYQPEASIAFQVFDADTKLPLERYTVHYGSNWLTEQRGEDGRIVTERPDGRGRLGDLRPSGSDYRLQFEIRASGYETYRRDAIALGSAQELDLGEIYLEPVPVLRLTVLDEVTREPVVGARATLEKQPELTPGRTERRISLDVSTEEPDSHGATVELHGEVISGRTDENGVVELTSLQGETCLVTVKKDGYAPGKIESLFLPVGDTVERTLGLGKGGSVLVQVLDPKGQPMAGQRIEHRTPTEIATGSVTMAMNASTRDRVTDSAGELRFENLEAGVHAFKLNEGGPGGMFVSGSAMFQIAGLEDAEEDEWTQVDVAPSLESTVTLRAAERGTLTGRITEAGVPLAGARVSLEEKSEGPSLGLAMAGFGGGINARCDGGGRYELRDVKEGDYVLSVSHPTRHMTEEFAVEVVGGENAFDADLPLSIIEGRITGIDDEPLAGVRVVAERAPEEGGPQVRQRMVMIMESDGGDTVISSGNDLGAETVYTDADGRYRLRGVTADTPLLVKAEGDDVQPGESDPVTVDPGEVKRGVDLTLDVAGSVEVEALLDGAPARFCMVRANYDEPGVEGVEPKFGFIQSGKTTLRGMRPGKWLVSVNREGPGGGAPGEGGQERLVEVKAGETAKETFHLDG